MSRIHVTSVNLVPAYIGTSRKLAFRHYGPEGNGKAYIQTSLHADELPGLLVVNHLSKLLNAAALAGHMLKEVVLVPYANPIGLSQNILGLSHGRFSASSLINFNREWPDLIKPVKDKVAFLLTNDAAANVKIIRTAISEEIEKLPANREDKMMKKEIYKVACTADIVLDMHCDSGSLMHLYTHNRLWPELSDLAMELDSQCNILSSNSGGNACDESFSDLWSALQDAFPEYPIPMAVHAATIELRGQNDVSDELASKDAHALFRFLQRRGFIAEDALGIRPSKVLADYTVGSVPLTGVDFMESEVHGLMVWKIKPGMTVQKGALLGEIVNIEDMDAPRTPIHAKTDGFIYSISIDLLVQPGDHLICVAGSEVLTWRQGNLLTAK